MAFQISEFTSNLRNDGARPNLFQVTLNNIPGIGGGAATSDTEKSIQFLAKAAQLPGSTIGTVPLYYFGREVKLAGNRTFADWTITVINDEGFKVRKGIEAWMTMINGNTTNVRSVTGGLSGYSIDGYVEQFTKIGTSAQKYKFVGMFPVDMSPIDLDWGSNDTVEEFTVTFAYQNWTTADIGYFTGSLAGTP